MAAIRDASGRGRRAYHPDVRCPCAGNRSLSDSALVDLSAADTIRPGDLRESGRWV